MIIAEFTEEMQKILSDMKGKIFLSLKGHKSKYNRFYGNFRIYLDSYAIDFKNEEQGFKFSNDEMEDMSCFSCEIVKDNAPFVPFCVGDTPNVYIINEKIVSVSLIRDEININNGEDEISFDVALIIKTEKQTYMFARDVWFSELITLSYSEDYDKVFSVEEVIKSWSNEGEYDVKVNRKKIDL